VDIWDILLTAPLAVFALLSGAWGWFKLYKWIVKPARYHQPPRAPLPSNPNLAQNRR
jgi:hypothetical protein